MGVIKTKTGLWLLVYMAYLLPFILHVISFFTPSWIIEDEIRKGLFYQCSIDPETFQSKDCSLKMLDRATIGIEGTCVVLMLCSTINTVLSVFLYGPDRYNDFDNDNGCCRTFNGVTFYCCSITCYPVTGILILSGCIRFGSLFPTEVLGASFYLCAIAGCLQFVMILVSCCDMICKSRSEEFVFKSFFKRLYEGETFKGLFYQCLAGNDCDLQVLDQPTIGLEGTCLVLALFGCVYSVLSVCLYGPDDNDFIHNDGVCYTCNCLSFYCCGIGMYPVNGILILCGCVRFGTQFHTETLGVSFYLCAVAGCLHFIMMFISCCDACFKKSGEEFVFKTLVQDIYEDAID